MNTPAEQLSIPALVLAILVAASITCAILRRTSFYQTQQKLLEEVISRVNAWWIIAAVFVPAVAFGFYPTLLLFFCISILALREYMRLIDAERRDHRALFWSFVLITPVQYYLIGIKWYGLYSIFIPVYSFLFVPAVLVIRGDCERFLERTAKIQWGLMACVFLLSHGPALLTLDIPGYEAKQFELIFFLVVVAQLSDVFQFISGKAFGRRKIAPSVSPNKTWGGFLGGLVGSAAVGAGLAFLTPFSIPIAVAMSALIVVAGFFGGLIMSAVKRDYGVKDYGSLIPGHGGILDRLDSLIFSAPLFFHMIRYFFSI